MWPTAALWLAAFAITVAETWIATWEGRADRQATSCKDARFSRKAAFHAGNFELVLLIDLLLVVTEGMSVFIPIYLGAVFGKYTACERRRKKFRSRTKQPKNDTVADSDEDE